MSDGNDTDASGRSSEGSAALRAQLDDIADTVGVVARAVSDLDQRIQLAQAASTAADQRWEQRITTMESHLAELDAVLRSETEQVRGSTSVLELLSHEIRTSLAQNREVTEFASGLQESLDALANPGGSGDVAALADRMNDFDAGIAQIARSVASLEASFTTVRERQIDPEVVLGAMQRIADRQPDLDPLVSQLDQMARSLPDLAGLHESLDARESDLVPIHHELLALRMTQPDMTEVLDGLQDLRDRQIDLTPVHEELRELRSSQPDVASVVDALDALQASLPAQFRELEGRLLDVSALADSLDLLVASQPDIQPIAHAVDALRAQIAELAEPASSPTDAEPDAHEFEPLLMEIRALRLDPPDLTPVIEAIDTLRAEVPDLGATNEAVTELRTSLGDSLHKRLETLLTTALDRQRIESEASRDEIRAIDDHLAPISGALQSVADRLGTIEEATAAHAEHLAEQSGELIGLRSDTSGLATTIPDAVMRLDVLSEDLRSVTSSAEAPGAVMERLGLIATELDQASRLRETERAELAELSGGLADVRVQVNEVLTHVTSAPSGSEIDLGPSLAALDERLTGLLEERDTSQGPTADLAQRIERLVNDGMGDIERAVAARQIEHQSVVSGLIGSIPDATTAIDALGTTIADRERELSADLVARLDALTDRTDGGLQSVRESIEDRLFSLDESRSADAATIRAAVDRIDSQERLVADQLASLAEQIAASGAASDELWLRTTEVLGGVEASATNHSASIEALATAHHQLIERDDGNQERLTQLGVHFGELRRTTEEVEQTLRSFSPTPNDDGGRAGLTEVLQPLAGAIDALAAQATEHRARLDAVGRSVDGFEDLGPRFEQSHSSLEQRIDALLDRQADLVASVRDLHPRFDTLDEHDPREPIGELLNRITVTESDLGVVGPKLEEVLSALERTEQRVTVQATTLDRVDERSEHLATAVAGLATSAERLERLDHLGTEIAGLTEAMAGIDMPAVTSRLTDLSTRMNHVRDEVGAAAAGVLERVDAAARASTERLDQQPGADDRTEAHLSSLATTTAEVAHELAVLRGDLTTRHDEFERQLDTIRSRSDRIAEASQQLVDADAGIGAGLGALGDRLDLLERRSTEADQSLNREVALIRTGLAAQLADLAGPITTITEQLTATDLTQLSAQIERTADEHERSARDVNAAMAASAETSDFLRDALIDLSTRVASIDLDVVRTRLESLEDEQRAAEQRLASSLSNVHAVVDTFELEPVLSRLESLEIQSGESERSLLAAIADVRNAAMAIDLGRVDNKINELEQRSRLVSDELSHKITDVVTIVGQLDLSALSESLATLDTKTASQRDEVRAAIDSLASGLDLEGFGTRLDALGRQATESAATEAEVRAAIRSVSEQLGDLDLQPISTRLDQLVDAVHATDEASRTSLASEIESLSLRIAELDTERMSARLIDLTGAQDRLAATVETELAATVDRVRTAVADESESRLSSFTDAADQRSREIASEIQALRDTVLNQFSEATAEQRQRLVERIDALGNTVVDRLDDTRVQTDSLAAQVTSIHAAFASSGPTSGDVRAHIDAALEGVTERIGGALRDLRREITDLGTATETAGIRSSFEAGLERLGQRFDADISRVLDAVADDADGERLRRIDRSITEIRRDFEVLRRIGDQALPPPAD